jgi:hypothetical protein
VASLGTPLLPTVPRVERVSLAAALAVSVLFVMRRPVLGRKRA